jgi:hypothetical protein
MTGNYGMRDDRRASLPVVSVEEQREMGLIRYQGGQRDNYVPAAPQAPQLPAQTGHHVTLDIAPHATQHIELRTSAVDRAKGHAISTSILGAVLGVLAVLAMWALQGYPFLSFWLLIVFWCVFAAVWAGSWFWTQLLSAEGVSFFEAHRKWRVIEREQEERWNHYRRVTGGDR